MLLGTYHEIKDVQEFKHHAGNLGVPEIQDDVYEDVISATVLPVSDFAMLAKGKLQRGWFYAVGLASLRNGLDLQRRPFRD